MVQYGTKTLTLKPELEVRHGVPGLFYTRLILPSGESQRVNIDTGSVGIVIPHRLVFDQAKNAYQPWAVPTGKEMVIEYKPSNIQHSGPIVTLHGLTLSDGAIEIGPVNALAHWGEEGFMMGVGFGLQAISRYLAPADLKGKPAENALDNPFLAVQGMSKDPTAAFQAAYTVSVALERGNPGLITFGQTAESVARFMFLPLMANPEAPAGLELPWIDVTAKPAGGNPLPTKAQLLVDTGITNMFLGIFEPSPAVPGKPSANEYTDDWIGAAVDIRAANPAGQTVMEYSFVNSRPGEGFSNTDPSQPASPSKILHGGSPGQGSFVNTGVHLLAKYDYHVDAAHNQLGFRTR